MENIGPKSQILRSSMKKSSIIFGILIVLFCSDSQGQEYSTKDKKAIQYFEEAMRLYRQRELNASIAQLNAAVERDSVFIEALLETGLIYGEMRDFKSATPYLEKVVQINSEKFPEASYYLGTFYLNRAKYEASKASLERFIGYGSPDLKKNENAEMLLAKCEFALKNANQVVEFNPVNLGPGVNSQFPEYYPCMTADEFYLLYTRQIPSPRTIDGQNEDFYFALNDGRSWSKSLNIGPPINSLNNEGAPTLSVDGTLLIFTGCALYGDYGPKRTGNGSCDLFFSQRNGNTWSLPRNLGPPINTANWETQPSFSSDGRTLYFIRGIRSGAGIKEQDIYRAYLSDSGWSVPEKLPEIINSRGREESVFIHPDGRTLYFSSDGHPGYGGLDIFMSQLDENGNWTEPKNLGYPINTENDENSLMVNARGTVGYFASDRPGGYGSLDLYQFEMPGDKRPDLVTFLKGRIFDSATKRPLLGKFELIDLETGETVIESYSNGGNGEFLVCLPPGKDYALNASKDGYLFYSDHFTMKNTESSLKPYIKDIPLIPIKEGARVVLNNIFFETNKYDLKPQSLIELNKLNTFLQKNSNVKIEIGGHTDNTGGKELNITLSKNRAKSVYDYLISKGISSERLSFKGYADDEPIATNESITGRAQNRRTEFKIVGFSQ
ncbi:MAG: OmpA family protein [Vicingaceae bacterium]